MVIWLRDGGGGGGPLATTEHPKCYWYYNSQELSLDLALILTRVRRFGNFFCQNKSRGKCLQQGDDGSSKIISLSPPRDVVPKLITPLDVYFFNLSPHTRTTIKLVLYTISTSWCLSPIHRICGYYFRRGLCQIATSGNDIRRSLIVWPLLLLLLLLLLQQHFSLFLLFWIFDEVMARGKTADRVIIQHPLVDYSFRSVLGKRNTNDRAISASSINIQRFRIFRYTNNCLAAAAAAANQGKDSRRLGS